VDNSARRRYSFRRIRPRLIEEEPAVVHDTNRSIEATPLDLTLRYDGSIAASPSGRIVDEFPLRGVTD